MLDIILHYKFRIDFCHVSEMGELLQSLKTFETCENQQWYWNTKPLHEKVYPQFKDAHIVSILS